MSVHLYHRPKAEDLTLADVIVDSLEINGTLTLENDETIDNAVDGTVNIGGNVKVTENSDYIALTHDGTDAYIKTNDGRFIFQTDETNAGMEIQIKPNGTSESSGLQLLDASGIRLKLYTGADRAYIVSDGGALGINNDAEQDVRLFENAAAGETKELKIYGYRTSDSLLSLDIGVGVDAADTASFDGVSYYQFDGELNTVSQYGTMQTATGDGTTTIDWGVGNFMYFTFGAQNDTFTFTAPANKGRIILVLKQDGTGSRLATWPGTVLWPGNVAPTLSTGANEVDIVSLFYDGTNYFGVANYDFS